MSTLREAAQQALEALEDVDGPITALLGSLLGSPDADAPGAKVRTSITALRAALAQQAEPVQVAERERIASQWDGCVTHQLDTFGPVNIGASIRAGELVDAQQAEPQETIRAQHDALQEALAQWRAAVRPSEQGRL